MDDRDKPMKPARGRAAAVVCFFVFPVLSLGSPMAAENDCDALLKSMAGSREIPAIVIDPANETVRIATSKGVCSESIEAWSKREPLTTGKTPAKKPSEKTQKSPAPKVPSPTVVVKPVTIEKPVSAPAPAPAPTPAPASKPVLEPVAPTASPGPAMPLKSTPQAWPCDYRLKEVWDSQVLVIEGIKHWLSRAFTLDLDGDRKVDNVSFTFVAKGDTKTVIHYFGAAGELSGWSYPALKLPQESVIKRLCFDDVTYEKPKFFEDAPLKPKWIEIGKPDLAGEMDAKEKGVTYKKKAKKKKKKEPVDDSLPWWVWALIGAGVVAGAGGLWAFLGGKGGDKDDEGEDDGERNGEKDDKGLDEDDGDDDEKLKKSKFNLGALFKRGKKKGEDGEEDNDEDEEDGDENGGKKKKKSKFSLGGLFKRSKKKGKDGDDDEDDDEGRGSDIDGDEDEEGKDDEG